MTLYIKVKGDTNDADYITLFEKVSHMDLKLVNKVANAIATVNEAHPYENNWPNSEYSRGSLDDLYIKPGLLTEDEVDIFNENYVPWGMGGVHSIESIQILDIVSIEEKL
jgi:hypothetical protein